MVAACYSATLPVCPLGGDPATLVMAIPRILRDPDDDRVIACAVAGGATFIVSGDRDLLALGQVGRISILTAAEFLEVLERTARRPQAESSR